LAWAEAVTKVNETRIPDLASEAVRREFPETELADLTLGRSLAIHSGNRLAIARQSA